MLQACRSFGAKIITPSFGPQRAALCNDGTGDNPCSLAIYLQAGQVSQHSRTCASTAYLLNCLIHQGSSPQATLLWHIYSKGRMTPYHGSRTWHGAALFPERLQAPTGSCAALGCTQCTPSSQDLRHQAQHIAWGSLIYCLATCIINLTREGVVSLSPFVCCMGIVSGTLRTCGERQNIASNAAAVNTIEARESVHAAYMSMMPCHAIRVCLRQVGCWADAASSCNRSNDLPGCKLLVS